MTIRPGFTVIELLFVKGLRIPGTTDAGGWTDPNVQIALDGSIDLDGSDSLTPGQDLAFGRGFMNCTNDNRMSSFHLGGGNVAFADGSIRIVDKSVRLRTFDDLVMKIVCDIPVGDCGP